MRMIHEPSESLLLRPASKLVIGVTTDEEVLRIVRHVPVLAVALVAEPCEVQLATQIISVLTERSIAFLGLFERELVASTDLPAGGVCVVLPHALALTSFLRPSTCIVFFRSLSDPPMPAKQWLHLQAAFYHESVAIAATHTFCRQPNYRKLMQNSGHLEEYAQALAFAVMEMDLAGPLCQTLLMQITCRIYGEVSRLFLLT